MINDRHSNNSAGVFNEFQRIETEDYKQNKLGNIIF